MTFNFLLNLNCYSLNIVTNLIFIGTSSEPLVPAINEERLHCMLHCIKVRLCSRLLSSNIYLLLTTVYKLMKTRTNLIKGRENIIGGSGGKGEGSGDKGREKWG